MTVFSPLRVISCGPCFRAHSITSLSLFFASCNCQIVFMATSCLVCLDYNLETTGVNASLHPQPLSRFAGEAHCRSFPGGAARQGFDEQAPVLFGQHAAIKNSNYTSV